MQTSSPPETEAVRVDGAVTIIRTRLAEPRVVSAAEAEALFQERVIELECGCVARTADTG